MFGVLHHQSHSIASQQGWLEASLSGNGSISKVKMCSYKLTICFGTYAFWPLLSGVVFADDHICHHC